MTQEKAKELLPIIQAIADGKDFTLQTPNGNGGWVDCDGVLDSELFHYTYRIKPEENFDDIVEADHSCNCKGCKYISLESVDEPCCDCIDSDKYKSQFRPFKDCSELIEYYQKKYKSAVGCDIYFPSLYKPCIWIRDKTEDAKGDIELITGFTEHGNVLINGTSYPLQHLFQMYEFLDGSPCGLEE